MVRILFGMYLGLFFLDGMVSFLDDFLQLLAGKNILATVRNALAVTAFYAGFPVLIGMFLSPRFPKRILLPPVLFLIWTGLCCAFPLNLFSFSGLPLILSGLQFAAGGLLLAYCREPDSWKPFHSAFLRPSFSWKNLLAGTALAPLIGFSILPFFLCGQLVSILHAHTGGYLRVRPDGLYLAERHFKKDERELRLIGMMHLGQDEFYVQTAAGLPLARKSVVLLEGITNESHMETPALGYQNVAGALGLTAQNESAFEETVRRHMEEPEKQKQEGSLIEFQNADVDLSDFKPETLDYLDRVGMIYDSKSWREFLENLEGLNKAYPEENPPGQVIEDILFSRNNHLFNKIGEALEEYPVVLVPWGALHLPDIENRLLKQGFRQTFSTERKVLSFW